MEIRLDAKASAEKYYIKKIIALALSPTCGKELN